jgi:hypothetical protein
MFGDIFYFFGLLLFLVDLGVLLKYSKIQKIKNWVEAFFKVTKRKPNKQDMNLEDFKELNSFNLVLTINFLWIFFGLITKSWKFYLLVLIINLFLNLLIEKSKSLKSISHMLGVVKIFILVSAVGLLVINHFHLHLDLFEITTSKFKSFLV